jgi:hypothetical protein
LLFCCLFYPRHHGHMITRHDVDGSLGYRVCIIAWNIMSMAQI